MEKQSINKGIEFFKSEAKKQNKTLGYTSVCWNEFETITGITKRSLLVNFGKHPFSIVTGEVMINENKI